ncbi:MAG: type II toxin-antitoxin system RelE/ParE family toxin [Candidatus Hydrogenedentota bacterium]
MPSEIVIRPKAKADVVEQALYIAEDNPDAAEGFLTAIEDALSVLVERPEIGARHYLGDALLEGIRMWTVKGFGKHLIFYRVALDGVEIVRVLYASRDIAAILDDLE